jgi:hypothetical protein
MEVMGILTPGVLTPLTPSRARLASTKNGFFGKDWFTCGGKLDKMCTSPKRVLHAQVVAELKTTDTS